jgi:hypothetical protein
MGAISAILLYALLAPSAPAGTGAESPFRNRAKFAGQLGEIQVGMSRWQVGTMLGTPDDIWYGNEVNASHDVGLNRPGSEVWAYGGNGHLTFPTLGKVSFDKAGKVVEVVGQSERPVSDALPAESATRRILRLIDGLKGYGDGNDPLRVIQVVNALQPLGKTGALAMIDEYLRASDPIGSDGGREGLFVVVRCLFDVPKPPGYLPPMLVGAPRPAGPQAPRRSPRFPVVLYRDIPFVGISGYMLAGEAEPLESHLRTYCEHGTIRARPLRPPDNPLAVIDGLVATPEWPDWGGEKDWGKAIAREQALRLVDSVYRTDDANMDSALEGRATSGVARWRADVAKFQSLGAHWDPTHNIYVRVDGTSLAPRPEPYTYPRTWLARTSAGLVKVELQRQDNKTVNLWLSASAPRPPMPSLRIYCKGKEIKTGGALNIPAAGSLGTSFDAREDGDIGLVLEQNGAILARTLLRP